MSYRNFAFGKVPGDTMRLTNHQAREFARVQDGTGLVWMMRRGHWAIVANYEDGRVYEGNEQIVPTPLYPAWHWAAAVPNTVTVSDTPGLEIELAQNRSGQKLFKVRYGESVKTDLTYAQASMEVGASVLHSLACQGLIDNDGA
jgi:hypothetical protein